MKLKIITYAAMVAGCCMGNWIVGMENSTDKNSFEQEQTNETNKQKMTTINDLVKFFNEKTNLYELNEIAERFGDEIKEACKEITKKDWCSESAMMQAMPGNIELVKFLIEFGLDDIDAQETGSYMTLLMVCISMEWSSEITELLIEKGAKLDLPNEKGKTALMWAIDKSQFKIAQLLIKRGANIHLKDNEGKTALTYAVERTDNPYASYDLIKTLLLHGAQCDQGTKKIASRKLINVQYPIDTAYSVQKYVHDGSKEELDTLIDNFLKKEVFCRFRGSVGRVQIINSFDFLSIVLSSMAPCDKHKEYCPVHCCGSYLGRPFLEKITKNHQISSEQIINVLQRCNFISPNTLKYMIIAEDHLKKDAKKQYEVSSNRESIKNLLLSGKQKNNKEINKIIESHGMVKFDDLHDLKFEYL